MNNIHFEMLLHLFSVKKMIQRGAINAAIFKARNLSCACFLTSLNCIDSLAGLPVNRLKADG